MSLTSYRAAPPRVKTAFERIKTPASVRAGKTDEEGFEGADLRLEGLATTYSPVP